MIYYKKNRNYLTNKRKGAVANYLLQTLYYMLRIIECALMMIVSLYSV